MGNSNFIDYVKLNCRSGSGGKGSTFLLRTKTTSKGGPAGGDGGRGGHIIAIGSSDVWTLLNLKYRKHVKAEHGGDGGRMHRTGAEGADEYLKVPLGTIIRDAESGDLIGEITEEGQEFILAKGGRGGKGNDFFKSSTFQTPRFAQPGEDYQELWIVLELKILADVGLVGFPNAGKSTLLSVVSAAKPEIANYAFTTLVPNLGMVYYRGERSFVMADIPGIIEGAHEGKGLGTRFLRHIERNSTLLFMIPADSDDIENEYNILLGELEKYNPELLDKPRLLAISKSDMLDEELKDEISKNLPKLPHLFISAVANQGITELKDLIWKTISEDN